MLWLIVKIAAAVVAIVVLYVVGAGMVRSFNGEPPFSQPPEPGELKPVDFRYRCIVCGALVTMTAAPDGDVPEAPRHCREDMLLVSDIGALDGGWDPGG
jgi:hypothetical protein